MVKNSSVLVVSVSRRMFRNRISVVRRARATAKSTTAQSSLSSTSTQGEKGDGPPSDLLEEHVSLPSCASKANDTPSVANESVVMQCAKPDEGICIDETVFSMDDSGEIGENELRLAEDDDNEVTKDLDFSRPSPTLFSLTSPKRARMMLEIQKSIDRNASSVIHAASSSMVTPSTSSSCTEASIPDTSQSVFGCTANATPQQAEHQNRTPWSIRSSVQSKQAGTGKRQSIAGAIDDLNEMTEELIDFIRCFDEKYTGAIN